MTITERAWQEPIAHGPFSMRRCDVAQIMREDGHDARTIDFWLWGRRDNATPAGDLVTVEGWRRFEADHA